METYLTVQQRDTTLCYSFSSKLPNDWSGRPVLGPEVKSNAGSTSYSPDSTHLRWTHQSFVLAYPCHAQTQIPAMFAGGFHKAGMTTRENQQEQTGRARMDSVDHGHEPNICDNKYGSLSVLACLQIQTSLFKPKTDICLGHTPCSSPLSLHTHAKHSPAIFHIAQHAHAYKTMPSS
jgi:hypothetical protein